MNPQNTTTTPPVAASAVPESVLAAARLRRDGHVAEAVELVRAELLSARATPWETPFRERVLLGLTLADLYVSTDRPEGALRELETEIAFAAEILDAMTGFGSPDEIRAASAGSLQLRDRAAQIALLGRPAPDLQDVEWLNVEPTTLAAQRGNVVLLEFWAPWCRSCTAMFLFLRDLQTRYAASGLTIIAVTNHRDGPDDGRLERLSRDRELIQRAVGDQGVHFPVAVSSGNGVRDLYGANGIPTFAVVDRVGHVRLASSKPDKSGLERLIADLLGVDE